MSGRSCSAANKVFFKADLLPFQEAPQRVAGDGDATFAQFTAQGMKSQIRLFIKPRQQPIALPLQKKGALAAHGLGGCAAGCASALRPLHNARYADIEHG